MYYFVIRETVFFLFAICCFIFLWRKHRNSVKNIIFICVISLAFLMLSALLPIEQNFLKFSSIESAFKYTHDGEIQRVVEGYDTDFVLSENNNDVYNYSILPKYENYWSFSPPYQTKKVLDTYYGDNTISVYKHKDIDEMYITVLNIKGQEIYISDNCNSMFVLESLDCGFNLYLARIENFGNYMLTIDNCQIELQKEQEDDSPVLKQKS